MDGERCEKCPLSGVLCRVENIFKKLFPSRGGSGLGIEITQDQITVAQLVRRAGQQYDLKHLVSAPTPAGAIMEGRIEDTAAVSSIIQDLFQSNNIKAKQVATAIPTREAVIRLIPLPADLQAAELREVVLNQEAELYLPFPRHEAYVDYQPLEEVVDPDGVRRQEVLLTAAPHYIVDSYIQAIEQADLTPQVVDISSFALIRAVRSKLLEFSPEEALALVVIQTEATELSILVKGIPRFTRTIPIGTWEFKETLSRALDLPPGQASSLLQSLTPPLSSQVTGNADDQSFSGRGLAALRRILTELTEEIQRSLDFYLSQGEVAPLSQLLLAGPGATMNQMDQYLSQRLNLPATRLDPVSILALPDNIAVAEESRPSIGTVLGLGLRNL